MFGRQFITYSEDRPQSKVLAIAQNLRGAAQTWFNPIYERNDPILDDYIAFLNLFKERFRDPNRVKNAATALRTGNRARSP